MNIYCFTFQAQQRVSFKIPNGVTSANVNEAKPKKKNKKLHRAKVGISAMSNFRSQIPGVSSMQHGTYKPTAGNHYMRPSTANNWAQNLLGPVGREGSGLLLGGPPVGSKSIPKQPNFQALKSSWVGPQNAPPPTVNRGTTQIKGKTIVRRRPSIIEVSNMDDPFNIETTHLG